MGFLENQKVLELVRQQNIFEVTCNRFETRNFSAERGPEIMS
jgi:hypothetical protein